ncbi:hypothetical protein GKO46_13125 [SAR202 cluster bacterium JH702]|uniref:Terminase small subunit n=1 Tax=Candidatus Lucifugimonas marina TaxID=3038979 RepID=A0ABD4XTQ0_9CHLR|nr:hypothetical protein [SAR202 cluster bacterium JH702]
MSNQKPKQTYSGGELVAFHTSNSQRRPGNKNAVKRSHLYAVKSGAHSENRRTSRLSAKVWATLPWLEATDEPAVRAWAQAEILSTELYACLMNEGVVTADGRVTGLLAEWRRTKELQLRLERELGMTPASRASLGVDVARGRAIDLAAEITEARQTGGK